MKQIITPKLAALVCCILSPLCLRAEDAALLKERLHTAATESSLDASGLKPWHLLLSFQLLDVKGKTTESGTIEEWWAAPNLYKTVYTSPSYNNTEIRNERGLYKASPDLYPPETLSLVIDQTVHPMADQDEVEGSRPDLRKEPWGKVPLDCIMLDQKITNLAYPPLGLFPTFCFDRDKNTLRASYSSGSVVVVRNRIGLFQGKNVAIDQSIAIDTQPAIRAHLEKLVTFTSTAVDFQPQADWTLIDEHPAQISESMAAGSVIRKINPVYPDRAKANHVSGTVVLRALIGTDGRIHHLTLLSSPDPDLALASFAAVRNWTYKPYLLNGRPTMVDTKVTVHFSFGPG